MYLCPFLVTYCFHSLSTAHCRSDYYRTLLQMAMSALDPISTLAHLELPTSRIILSNCQSVHASVVKLYLTKRWLDEQFVFHKQQTRFLMQLRGMTCDMWFPPVNYVSLTLLIRHIWPYLLTSLHISATFCQLNGILVTL